MSFPPVAPSMPRTEEAHSRFARRLVLGLAATLAVALAAHIAFHLWFTPVPFTLQPLAVLLVGLLLGPEDGAFVMLAYLFEGAMGLPVFSPTGVGGFFQLFGPTGGFLLAYPAVAFVAGWVANSFRRAAGSFVSALLGSFAAIVLLFTVGALWLAHVSGLHGHALWMAAVLPFLPGEAVKIFVAAGVYRALRGFPQAASGRL